MTMRLTLGVDPGQTGAVALLADGRAAGFVDMPISARKAGGHEINTADLADKLRDALRLHAGAYVMAVLEAVSAMPKQGVTSAFRFGESFGAVKGVLGAVGIGYILVPAQVWKRHLKLTGCEKDAARTMAIQRFPECAPSMLRKKDIGRADALLLAHYAEITEQVARAA